MSDGRWFVERNAVIRQKDTGDLWHVLNRYKDVDDGHHKYRIACDTHTQYEHWREEDVEDCFRPTGVVVGGVTKPKHVLDGRLYESEREEQDDYSEEHALPEDEH